MFNKSRFFLLAQFLFLLILLQSCGKKNDEPATVGDSSDIVKKEKKRVPFDLNYPKISYQIVELKSKEMINSIQNKYRGKDSLLGASYRKALRTLNRKELRFWSVGQTVVVPDSVVEDMRAYSIFPDDYPGAANLEKIIIIDNKYQAYGCYEYGKLMRFAAANTGKERTPTFPGRYSLVWKARLRKSSLDSTWVMPFTFNFHKYAGNAMHAFSMPGRPVSHSCVRQFIDDAEWIYKWGNSAKYDENKQSIPFSGTPVIILNMFDYSRKQGGPWLELPSNKSYYVELPPNPLEVEEALIPWVQIPQSSRGVITNRERYLFAEDTLRARGIIRPEVVLIETVDFNKLRREKKKAEQLKEEQLKKELELKQNDTIEKINLEEQIEITPQ